MTSKITSKIKKIAPFLFSFAFLIVPALVFAADSSYFPICECCANNTPCTLKNFFEVVDKLIKALLYLSFFIAVIMIIKGGVHILLAAGSPDGIKKGRETVTWAIYGMIIAFGAWLIINTVLTVLTKQGGVKEWLPF